MKPFEVIVREPKATWGMVPGSLIRAAVNIAVLGWVAYLAAPVALGVVGVEVSPTFWEAAVLVIFCRAVFPSRGTPFLHYGDKNAN